VIYTVKTRLVSVMTVSMH